MQIHDIEFDLEAIRELCRGAGVVRAHLFGSILTDRFGPDSDIDVLVETEPGRPPGLLALGRLQTDLSDMLGRTVHLTLLSGLPAEQRRPLLERARALDAA